MVLETANSTVELDALCGSADATATLHYQLKARKALASLVPPLSPGSVLLSCSAQVDASSDVVGRGAPRTLTLTAFTTPSVPVQYLVAVFTTQLSEPATASQMLGLPSLLSAPRVGISSVRSLSPPPPPALDPSPSPQPPPPTLPNPTALPRPSPPPPQPPPLLPSAPMPNPSPHELQEECGPVVDGSGGVGAGDSGAPMGTAECITLAPDRRFRNSSSVVCRRPSVDRPFCAAAALYAPSIYGEAASGLASEICGESIDCVRIRDFARHVVLMFDYSW